MKEFVSRNIVDAISGRPVTTFVRIFLTFLRACFISGFVGRGADASGCGTTEVVS